jgi:sterol desaturase/sphingolipid hydroxylase (fatty acid hydroxylase superfamily)
VILLGAPAAAVLAFEVAFTFANLIEHGDIEFSPRVERSLQRVLVTPALHRRHHSSGGPDRDRNFGTIFAIWDQLGRTYRNSGARDRINVGLDEIRSDVGPLRSLVLPFAGTRRTSPMPG